MALPELFILAVGLSMDAFAVAACAGLSIKKHIIKKALIVGLYFGFFQAAMPLIGYIAASFFAHLIINYDHWIAFALLCFLGGKMIYGSLGKGDAPGVDEALTPAKMLPLAVATSIDALAVGVSFAFLHVDIIRAAAFIGITTFILSALGVKTGNMFGTKLKSKSEAAGGAILILIGVKILLEHLNILRF